MAYSIEHKRKLVIPEYKWDAEQRAPYWTTVFKRLKDSVDPNLLPGSLPRYAEEFFHYTPLKARPDPFILFGYFQSYKYFDKHAQAINKKLNIAIEQETIKAKYLRLKNTISIHFRIGDYSQLQLHYALLKDDYYIRAIQEIFKRTQKDNWNIMYFCEEKDNLAVQKRMYKIKKQFPNTEFHKVSDELEDWEQLLLMSCATHNVIANSTFSWWAAYLNANPNKIVCHPSEWFGIENADKSTKDLCPPEWVKI